jgi:hypothetical protein
MVDSLEAVYTVSHFVLSLIVVAILLVEDVAELVGVSGESLLDLGVGLLKIVSCYGSGLIIILPYVSVEVLVHATLSSFLTLGILSLVERSNVFRRSHCHLLVSHALPSHGPSSRSSGLVVKRNISEMPQFLKLDRMSYLVLPILIW